MNDAKDSDGTHRFLRALAELLGLPGLAKADPLLVAGLDHHLPPTPLKIALPPTPPPVPIVIQPDWVAAWQTTPRIPLLRSDDPAERFFLRALRKNQPVTFTYDGGSEPGLVRDVHPLFLFRMDGCRRAYLTAYCRVRQELRTFRLDRVHLPSLNLKLSTEHSHPYPPRQPA